MVWTEGKDGKWRDRIGNVACPHGRRKSQCLDCEPAKYNKYINRIRSRRVNTGRTVADNTCIGYTNELLAAADMNSRCGIAYLNPAPLTKDDAFAKTSLGWKTVQVKTARLTKTKSGYSMPVHHRSQITSDIIALVDDRHLRVRYVSNTKDPLPPEFPSEPSPICSGIIFFDKPME
jgi:hypothetical protein